MKKIGMLGGVAWLSTVEYYAAICRLSEAFHAVQKTKAPLPTPEMSNESLDLNKAVSHIGKDGDEASWQAFERYHREALQRLETSGADFAIIASNLPHHRFREITRDIRMPILNLFDVVVKECARCGVEQMLILGTTLTMKSHVIRETLKTHGIKVFAPESEEEKIEVIKLIARLQLGKSEGVADRIGEIARLSFTRIPDARPVVCLACTELPLAFPSDKQSRLFEADGILYINTSAIHAKAAFEFAIGIR